MTEYKIGDFIVFPGIDDLGAAYRIVDVSEYQVWISIGGHERISFDTFELDHWFKRGTHRYLPDTEHDKFVCLLKYPEMRYYDDPLKF